MMNEDEEHYLTYEYITFEVFAAEMRELLQKEGEQLHKYKGVYLDTNASEPMRERAKKYVDECAASIAANARILTEAVDNLDYSVFIRSTDGLPMTRQVSPSLKRRIEQKMRETRLLYV